MADCSKTEVFFKELKRMCNKYSCTSCIGCEINQHCYDSGCYGFVKNNPLKAVEIVQKWSDKNPIKTRQSEFLKMFPEAAMSDDVIFICPRQVDMSFTCRNASQYCYECKKGYWFSEVE